MFLVSLVYQRPLEEVDRHLAQHADFLHCLRQDGYLIFSARKLPRSGGVMLLRNLDRVSLDQLLQQDPFWQHAVAKYEIQELEPRVMAAGLEQFLGGDSSVD